MTKKRANGEGSVRRRSDGRYEGRLVFTDAEGKLHRQSFYGRTSAEVRTNLRSAQGRLAAGAPVRDATRTLAEWIQQWSATSLEASPRKPTTKHLYRSLLRTHVLPRPISNRQLDRLRPTDIEAWTVALRSCLSSASVNKAFLVLRSCLDDAVRDGLLARNPARALKQPAISRTEARFLTSAEVRALLEQLAGGRHQRIVTLIAHLGLRKGEALALRWSDIDLNRARLRVSGTLTRLDGQLLTTEPKTASSRRWLPLSLELLRLLHGQRQAQEEDRRRAANTWVQTGMVFTTARGEPMDPRNVLRAVTTAAKQIGLEGVTVHTLRHSAATLMLESGVHLKGVSTLLGHADIRITAETYAHLSDDAARSALTGLSQSLAAPPPDAGGGVGVTVGVKPPPRTETPPAEDSEEPSDKG